jgi:hypothetical protein
MTTQLLIAVGYTELRVGFVFVDVCVCVRVWRKGSTAAVCSCVCVLCDSR